MSVHLDLVIMVLHVWMMSVVIRVIVVRGILELTVRMKLTDVNPVHVQMAEVVSVLLTLSYAPVHPGLKVLRALSTLMIA